MEKRVLGNTGRKLSVVGFGGIVVMDESPEDAARFVAEAVDRGVDYFDVAPTYGNAEQRLGPALEPFRDRVFLACKTVKRSRADAAADLRASLERMRTDHFDLYQLHGVATADEVKAVLAPGGALEAVIEARDRGLVRHIGFSAHSEHAAVALLEAFEFDSVLFPVNYACWHKGSFGPRALEAARAAGAGILALKALARREWKEGEKRAWQKCWYAPVDSPDQAALALRWALSRPGVVAAVSPSHIELLRWMCDAVDAGLAPLSQEQADHLARDAANVDPVFETRA